MTGAQAAATAVLAAAAAVAGAGWGSGPRRLSTRLATGPPSRQRRAGVPDGRAAAVVAIATAAVLGAAVVAGAVSASPGVAPSGVGQLLDIAGRSGLAGAAPVLAVVAVVATRARRRGRRRRVAVQARQSLIRATEVVTAELRVGAPPLDALDAAAEELPELGPVASAGRLGADVPAGLADLGARPGLAGLRQLAAAWAVSDDVGTALAGTVDRLTEALRADDAIREDTEVALATPRATARLLAVLPAGGLALGTVIGAHPWQVLTGSPAGAALGCAGAVLAGVGLEWVEALADRVEHTGSPVAPGAGRARAGPGRGLAARADP